MIGNTDRLLVFYSRHGALRLKWSGQSRTQAEGTNVRTRLPLVTPRTTSASGALSEGVYRSVRADLLSARYGPGQWVKVAGLQREFDVSLSVVREALSRLVAEGLLVVNAGRGFQVVSLSAEDLEQLTSARIQIETLVLAESLAYGDAHWETDLLAAHHLLESTPLRGSEVAPLVNPAWIPVHAKFHEALLAGCPNRRLRCLANSLRDSAEMYRMWTPRTQQRGREVAEDHQELLQAALTRNLPRCSAALRRHIERTRRALIEAEGGLHSAGTPWTRSNPS
jgi:DNA-binding GntR family transcriptional regulator